VEQVVQVLAFRQVVHSGSSVVQAVQVELAVFRYLPVGHKHCLPFGIAPPSHVVQVLALLHLEQTELRVEQAIQVEVVESQYSLARQQRWPVGVTPPAQEMQVFAFEQV